MSKSSPEFQPLETMPGSILATEKRNFYVERGITTGGVRGGAPQRGEKDRQQLD
jgi:hypothetical protein